MSQSLTQPSFDLTTKELAAKDVTASLPVITVDGSSGAGKGTLTARLAKLLDYQILDSGALYRIVGLAAHQAGLLTDNIDETALTDLTQSLKIEFAAAKAGSEHVTVLVNANDVSEVIRTEEVGNFASKVAVFPKVRQALLELQKNMATSQGNPKKGLIADGRDMGTVVFPDATLKVYLVASAEARAERRLSQLTHAGKQADFDEILAQIIARDERDSTRSASPAKPADDAIVIDSSAIDAEQVFNQVWQLCVERGLTIN